MRTIRFRAQDIASNKWLFGDIRHHKNDVCIFEQGGNKGEQVKPETVGQYTGLTDKNGKEIYEWDIVQWGDFEHKIKQVVEFRNGAFGYVYDTIGSFVPYAANTNFDFAALGTDKRFEVIGNVFNNPELLEKGGKHDNS